MLYGVRSHPYVIYTPRWIDTSAGIKALHLLCHSLNQVGEKAYLVFSEPIHGDEPRFNPNLMTPIFTQEIANAYFSSGITPIAVYPETIPGNPLNADFIVRYLMNFVGTLGGETEFDSSEYIISYSESIGKDYSGESGSVPTLFLPAIDPREFVFNGLKKGYQVVYAAKYRLFVGEPPRIGTLKNIEIIRDGPKRQSRLQVRKLISEASIVYVFENTAIIIESILSGTPVVLVKNSFFKSVIADEELGLHFSAEDDLSEIPSARIESNEKSRFIYLQSIEIFFQKLDEFVTKTQDLAKTRKVKQPLLVPTFSGSPLTTHRMRLALQIFKNLGLFPLLRISYYFVLRTVTEKFRSR